MSFAPIGLTGGIASGKSSASRIFAELGVVVVDADQVARDVVALGSDGLREVASAFGAAVLNADGTLDRKKLGELVFADAEKRKTLNAILHPRIAAESARRLAEVAATGVPYAIYDAPLLVENGIHRAMAATIVVNSDEATQISRLRTRDGLSEEAAKQRLLAQLPLAEKVAVADFVIENDGSLAELRARTIQVNDALRVRFPGGAAT